MLLDKTIHKTLIDDFDLLYKARVLSAILWIFIGIISFIDLWVIQSNNMHPAGQKYALFICLSMQFIYLISLAILKLKGQFKLAAQLTIFMTTLGVSGGTFISGGPLAAPAVSMNILPIILAFVLISKHAGLVWTFIVFLIHLTFILLQQNGFIFPQMLAQDTLLIQHLSHWVVIYIATIGLMFIYNTLNSRLKRERDDERKKFQHLASHDSLTSLANRLQFEESLNNALARADRNNKITALLFIDLDGFKPINDNFGHEAGDKVLKEIAYRLKQNFRSVDTIARLGGDEFGLILEDISKIDSLTDIAEKLLNLIASPIGFIKDQPSIGCSIGIALYPNHTRNQAELISFADTAMYKAKKQKNQWRFFNHNQTLTLFKTIPKMTSL